jgi:hypothetical protein
MDTKRCQNCDAEFSRPPSPASMSSWNRRRFCSRRCKGIAERKSPGMRKPHPSGASKDCERCGKTIVRTTANTDSAWSAKRFCSRACLYDFQRRKMAVNCTCCGKEFMRYSFHIDRHKSGHTFCTKRCAARWRTLNPTRQRFGCGRDFDRLGDIYGRKCVVCGFSRVVEWAHIIPAARGGTIHPDNIVALCPNHHTLMDKDLLTDEEQETIDVFLIRAWSSSHSAPCFEQSPGTSPPPSS